MEPQPLNDREPPPEHAFGKIHQITVPLKWAPTPKKAHRKARKQIGATTESWSVNGVGFTSTTNPNVTEGSILTITIGPITGEVVVRTVQPQEQEELTYYGVEMIDDDLQSVARDLISIHLRHRPEPRASGHSPLDGESPDRPKLTEWT